MYFRPRQRKKSAKFLQSEDVFVKQLVAESVCVIAFFTESLCAGSARERAHTCNF